MLTPCHATEVLGPVVPLPREAAGSDTRALTVALDEERQGLDGGVGLDRPLVCRSRRCQHRVGVRYV